MLANRMKMASGGGGYDADAQALFDAWGTNPGGARKTIVNQFFLDLKAAGVYTGLDEFWLLAGHDATDALLGGKRYKDCTAVNAPVFTVDEGYTSAETKYLNLNFTPSTDGVQYTLNSASLGCYSRTDTITVNNDMGVYKTAAPAVAAAVTHRAEGVVRIFINNTDVSVGFTVPDSLGFVAGNRSSATATQAYKNGSQLGTDPVSSISLNVIPFFLLTMNVNGSPGSTTLRQLAFAFVGRSFDATEHGDLFTAVETYMDAIGKGVVA